MNALIEIAKSWDGRVDRSGGPRACWPWTGALMTNGYGQSRVRQDGRWRGAGAHQIAHYLATGIWEKRSDGRLVRHLCHNRRCCNPAHLIGGTAADNTDDRQARRRGESLLPPSPEPIEPHADWRDLQITAAKAAADAHDGELRTRLRRRVFDARDAAFPDLSPVGCAITKDFMLEAWAFANAAPARADTQAGQRLRFLSEQFDQVLALASARPLCTGAAA